MIGVSDSEGFQSVTAGGRQMSILAAQYVRMSTDLQQYSIENQKEAILQYALQHEFAVIKTYTDAGKSGVVLKSRAGLKELLADPEWKCYLQGDSGLRRE
jgi:hypothetical protein